MSQQLVAYEAQPVSQPAGYTVNPDYAIGVVIALVVALLVIRYLKVILLLIVGVVLVTLVVGAAQVEPLISAAMQAIKSG